MRAKRSAEAELGLPEYRGHTLAEKVAFALLVLFVLAAVLGVFGDGPLSGAVASSADGRVRVEYQRFCRRVAPEVLDITFPVEANTDSIELSLDDDYLRRVQITETFPEPEHSSRDQRTGKLRFSTDGSGQPMTVRLHLQPRDAGWFAGRVTVGLPGKPASVRFEQLVYP